MEDISIRINNILKNTIGIDSLFLIKESFLGYKYRKMEHKLYDNDVEIPAKLIRLYYGLNNQPIDFNAFQKAFVTHYIHQESKLEGLDTKSIHSKAEIEGLEKMYEYVHSGELERYLYTKKLGFGSSRRMFSTMPDSARYDSSRNRDACIASTGLELSLLELHEKIYENTEFKEYSCYFRNDDRYLPGTGTEICEWSLIGETLKLLDIDFQKLLVEAERVKVSDNVEDRLKFIDECVVLKCKLIKVHPFFDGNGRTIRGLINVLFEHADLPPIYIKENERTEYHRAMNMANNDGNYTDIINFYKFKICDSIVELDINNRLRVEKDIQKKFSEISPEDQKTYLAVEKILGDMKTINTNEQVEIDEDGVKIYKPKRGTN